MAALHWTVWADRTLALRMIAAVAPYLWLRGLRGEAVAPAAELLADMDGPPAGMVEEYVLCVLAAIARGRRDGDPHLDRAYAIMAMPVFPPRHPYLTVLWAVTIGPPAEMADVEAIELGPDPWARGLTHLGRGFYRLFGGDRAAAEAEFERSLAGFRESGDRWGMAQALDQLAGLADWRGDRGQALGWFDAAIDLIGQLGAAEDLADLHCRRGDMLIRAGEIDRAGADFRQALGLASRVGAAFAQAGARRGLAEILRLRGDFVESRRLYEETLTIAGGDWLTAEIRSRIHTALARIAIVEGDLAQAWSRFDQALSAVQRPMNLPAAAGAIEGLAGLALAGNEPERAARLLGAAEAMRGSSMPGDPDVAAVAAAARAELGDAAYDRAYAAGAALTPDEALRSAAVSER
jgi:tetratricopeptide (TPR) repeat protein